MKNKYIKRAIEKSLFKHLKQFPVVALSGPRQSGKTTLLKHALGKIYSFIDMDDLDERWKAISDPKLFMSNITRPCVIDEIQYAPHLLSYIKMEVDADRTPGSFILTGSQQFLMMKGLSETLAGRVGIITIFPFNIIEIGIEKVKSTKKVFEDVIFKGLYPELVVKKSIDDSLWYDNYIRTYLERDIKALYNIGSLREFGIFLKMLALKAGQLLNMTTLSINAGVAVNTIKRWISILEASGIIKLIHPYYSNVSKRFVKMPKVYFIDTGLLCHLIGITEKRQLYSSPLFGMIFENFCFSEIIKILSINNKCRNIFFLRTNKGLEVDMMIETNKGFIQAEFKAGMSISDVSCGNMIRVMKDLKQTAIFQSYLVSMNDRNYKSGEKINSCGALEFFSIINSIFG